jgi:predicted RNA-binding Zn ribbon-like protein
MKDKALKLAAQSIKDLMHALIEGRMAGDDYMPEELEAFSVLDAIKAALTQPVQPPQRTWVGLTDEERSQLVTLHHGWNEYGQAIEQSLKEKNT